MRYVEGQNLAIERRCAEGKIDRLPKLAEELVQLRVDTLFAPSPVAIQAVKRATARRSLASGEFITF
jgi:hypothetical protein